MLAFPASGREDESRFMVQASTSCLAKDAGILHSYRRDGNGRAST
jgi:hypothetical protein